MNKTLSVTIIIPCYNQAEYLEATVNSIFEQTHTNWECILINDGSTDNTAQITEKLCAIDSRIKYFYKPNGGLSSARNEGLKRATGDFIQFLDSDDLLEKDKLQVSLNAITKNPLSSIVICDFVLCNSDNTIRLPPYCDLSTIEFNFDSILLHWDETFTIPIHCGLFNASLFKRYRFEEKIGAKEDWLMWLHIFSSSPNVTFVNAPLAIYRENPKSMSYNKWHMYENTSKAFVYVLDNMLEEKYKRPFFIKVNQFWKEEIQMLNSKVLDYKANEDIILKSPSYKIGKLLTSPFKLLSKAVLSPREGLKNL
jgi:glycosyltransferase involved in cell wall biosynthesis